MLKQASITSLQAFLDGVKESCPCPVSFFTLEEGDGITAPLFYLQYHGEGKTPDRCNECHIPKYEGRVGETHGPCQFEPCKAWATCLGKHEKGRKAQIKVLVTIV
jgi:hypothetical protein